MFDYRTSLARAMTWATCLACAACAGEAALPSADSEVADALAVDTQQTPVDTPQDTADTLQDAVEPSQDAVEPSQDTTETLQDAVETLQDTAETPQDTVETVQDTTETLQDTTETVQDTTETLQDTTETLQDTVETLLDITETVQDTAETLQDTTETVQDTAETLQDTMEMLQDTTETLQDIPDALAADAQPPDATDDAAQPDGSADVAVVAGVVQFATASDHSCAITSAHQLFCWGSNLNGQLGDGTTSDHVTAQAVIGLPLDVSQVSVAAGITCAVLSDGGIWCWGNGTDGQLGNLGSSSWSPGQISGIKGRFVSSTGSTTCAVSSDGSVWCWGANEFGQAGSGEPGCKTGGKNSVLIPAQVSGISGAVTLAAGSGHFCALTSSGSVGCWGSDTFGQLGDGVAGNSTADPCTSNSASVKMVPNLSGIVGIASGDVRSCAMDSGGTVFCWGSNTEDSLSLGLGNVYQTTPAPVIGLPAVSAIAMDSGNQFARVGGTVWLWGERSSAGCFGDGSHVLGGVQSPMANPLIGDAIAVGGCQGDAGGCVIRSTGKLGCWGQNRGGRLGNGLSMGEGGDVSSSKPGSSVNLSGITGVTSYNSSVCASKLDGSLWCWGHLRLPLVSTPSAFALPTEVTTLGSSVTVSLSSEGGCFVDSGGSAWCWGPNYFGQLGNGEVSSSFATQVTTPVQVSGSGIVSIDSGYTFGCWLSSSGSVSCWGDGGSMQLGSSVKACNPALVPEPCSAVPVPVDVSGVSAIALGESHACALSTSGGITCWGANAWNQAQFGEGSGGGVTPTSLPTCSGGLWTSVAPGGNYTCASCSSGHVWCWGFRGNGRLGDGCDDSTCDSQISGISEVIGNSGFVKVFAGMEHSCGITGSGEVWCWGDNFRGQLGTGSSAAYSSVAMQVSGLPGKSIALALAHGQSCALSDSGVVTCWGWNGSGEVGDGSAFAVSAVEVQGLP